MADSSTSTGTSKRGFASMDSQRKREIASKGGRAAHEKGTAHEFSPEEARNAGRKGSEVVSRNRDQPGSEAVQFLPIKRPALLGRHRRLIGILRRPFRMA